MLGSRANPSSGEMMADARSATRGLANCADTGARTLLGRDVHRGSLRWRLGDGSTGHSAVTSALAVIGSRPMRAPFQLGSRELANGAETAASWMAIRRQQLPFVKMLREQFQTTLGPDRPPRPESARRALSTHGKCSLRHPFRSLLSARPMSGPCAARDRNSSGWFRHMEKTGMDTAKLLGLRLFRGRLRTGGRDSKRSSDDRQPTHRCRRGDRRSCRYLCDGVDRDGLQGTRPHGSHGRENGSHGSGHWRPQGEHGKSHRYPRADRAWTDWRNTSREAGRPLIRSSRLPLIRPQWASEGTIRAPGHRARPKQESQVSITIGPRIAPRGRDGIPLGVPIPTGPP